jgi:hypothetical protein
VWYLIEDFFEQSWIMKLIQLWGWVSVLIMVLSLGDSVGKMIDTAQQERAAEQTQATTEAH